MRVIYHEDVVGRCTRAPNGDVHISFTESDRSETHVFPFSPEAGTELGDEIRKKSTNIEVPHGSGPVSE